MNTVATDMPAPTAASIIFITGSSSTGKTTLLDCIRRIASPIPATLNADDIFTLHPFDTALQVWVDTLNATIGMVFASVTAKSLPLFIDLITLPYQIVVLGASLHDVHRNLRCRPNPRNPLAVLDEIINMYTIASESPLVFHSFDLSLFHLFPCAASTIRRFRRAFFTTTDHCAVIPSIHFPHHFIVHGNTEQTARRFLKIVSK
jgi:energy-coupling factor transporter ATP-binding protein EcfA2